VTVSASNKYIDLTAYISQNDQITPVVLTNVGTDTIYLTTSKQVSANTGTTAATVGNGMPLLPNVDRIFGLSTDRSVIGVIGAAGTGSTLNYSIGMGS
jgi:hypothetical protein